MRLLCLPKVDEAIVRLQAWMQKSISRSRSRHGPYDSTTVEEALFHAPRRSSQEGQLHISSNREPWTRNKPKTPISRGKRAHDHEIPTDSSQCIYFPVPHIICSDAWPAESKLEKDEAIARSSSSRLCRFKGSSGFSLSVCFHRLLTDLKCLRSVGSTAPRKLNRLDRGITKCSALCCKPLTSTQTDKKR